MPATARPARPARTHRIGLIGRGIATSLSPDLHAREAAALGLREFRYELLDLDALDGDADTDLGAFLRDHVARGFTGFNVTHPCKQSVIEGLDALADDARTLGAVNTVTVEADGRLVGHNTDGSGFVAALHRGLPDVALDRVVLVGTGGAGSAVAHALAASGVRRLTLVESDPARADAVRARLLSAHPALEVATSSDAAACLPDADGVVNATPVGMDGHPGVPFDTSALRSRHWVADIVYRPVRTALLEAATAAGCRTLPGTQMLVAQAVDTFALLTGMTPDADRMRTDLSVLLARRAAA